MSQKVKVVINYAGVGELLKGEEMKKYLNDLCSEKAATLGAGYGYDVYSAGTRAIASVGAISPQAVSDNYQNNTILKVMGV